MARRSCVVVLVVLGLLLLVSCATQKPPVLGSGYLIKKVKLEGVTRFSKGKLLAHLFSGETSWVPTTPDIPFDQALVGADKARIIELYRSYGYYDAVVLGIETKLDRKKQKAHLTIRIDEGQPVRVNSLRFEWQNAEEVDTETRRDVESVVNLAIGAPFETPNFNDDLGSLRLALMQRGHPLARTAGRTRILKGEHRAEVVFEVDAGPRARIGTITYEGLVEVPERRVEPEVRFAVGELYSPARIRQIEQSLKAMRVFRWVSVRPPGEVRDGTVDLAVRVSESDPQSISLGAQLSMETVRWQEQVAAKYIHTNLFGDLTRLDLKAVAGYAEMPNPWDPILHGPVLELVPAFTRKGLFEDYLIWSLVPGIEVNVQEGYQYYSPYNRIGVSRWFGGILSLGLSHNLRFVDFFNVSPALDTKSSLLGRDYRDPFLISYLEAKAEAYFTDSITRPANGVVLDTTYDLAGGVLGGDFSFHKITGTIRAYWKPFARLQLAARLRTGLILTYGDEAGAPISMKYYLGGANSVRGFGSRHLSPRIEDCDTEDGSCSSIPVGGYTMLSGNLEARFLLAWKVYLVAFADAGDVQAAEATYKTDEWNYTAGPGLRWESPMGLIRLDFAWRLNDPGVFPDEPRWGVYFGLGEAF